MKQIAYMLMKRGFFEAVMVVRLVLKLLSTRLGTLFVCGTYCLSHKWPYLNKFSEIPLHKREKIVQSWLKHSFLTPIRLGFVFIKTLCLLVFFSQVIFSSFLVSIHLLMNESILVMFFFFCL